MTGIIGNGLSALLAAQRALQTASNNIANANTEGYVRQRVNFVERTSQSYGTYSIGQGVQVGSVDRLYDQFLGDQLRLSTSTEQRYAIYSALAGRLDTVLGNPDTGITTALQRFFDQVEAVGRDPTSIAMRQQLILEGQSLAARFAQLDSQVASLTAEVNQRLQQSATAINSLAGQLATLNDRIASALGPVPPELADQQELLLRRLADQIDVTTIRQPNGTVSVLVGSGQALVLGAQVGEVTTIRNPLDSTRQQLAIRTNGFVADISAQVSGGVVGGLLAFRAEVLDPARNELGRLALGLATSFNEQHRAGLDLNGNLGLDFFATAAPAIAASVANTGSATVTATVTEVGALTGADYELRREGASWVLRDLAGSIIPASGSGTAGDPLLAAGLAITITAGAAAGDRFLIRPTLDAAARLAVLQTNAAAIAAAGPLVAAGDGSNASTATVDRPRVTDLNDPKLLVPATIVFDSPTTYSVFTGGGADLVGPLPYSSGGTISFGGWEVAISGNPAAGDRFYVTPAGSGSGDNANALALSQVLQRGLFAGATQSLANLGADIIATAGAVAARSEADLRVQQVLRQQAELDVESLSGVNLDEEAADLLRYQQAYLAASKTIGIANDMFQNLLQILGR